MRLKRSVAPAVRRLGAGARVGRESAWLTLAEAFASDCGGTRARGPASGPPRLRQVRVTASNGRPRERARRCFPRQEPPSRKISLGIFRSSFGVPLAGDSEGADRFRALSGRRLTLPEKRGRTSAEPSFAPAVVAVCEERSLTCSTWITCSSSNPRHSKWRPSVTITAPVTGRLNVDSTLAGASERCGRLFQNYTANHARSDRPLPSSNHRAVGKPSALWTLRRGIRPRN